MQKFKARVILNLNKRNNTFDAKREYPQQRSITFAKRIKGSW